MNIFNYNKSYKLNIVSQIMPSLVVNHHPSVAIVKSLETDDFMFTRYDNTYPVIPYRLAANTMGGNPTPKDLSPWATWEREIYEEFNNRAPEGEELRDKVTPFAPISEIYKIRDAILTGARPRADFHFISEGITIDSYLAGVGNGLTREIVLSLLSDKKRNEVLQTGLLTRAHGAIISTYYSAIPQEEMERAKHYLEEGLRIVTEGGLRVLTRDQLIDGIAGEIETNKAYLTAHCTPFIMADVLGVAAPLMHAQADSAVKLETNVRGLYEDYTSDTMFD
jgi:hypothetical protein